MLTTFIANTSFSVNRCQNLVKAPGRRVKDLSGRPNSVNAACTLAPTHRERTTRMADVAYVALTVGIFGLLALMLRGLEKLQ